MRRCTLLAGAAGLLASPAVTRAAPTSVLKFVPQADLAYIDPVWTISYRTRDHAMMVYGTLFGTDASFAIKPQMLAGSVTAPGGLVWTPPPSGRP